METEEIERIAKEEYDCILSIVDNTLSSQWHYVVKGEIKRKETPIVKTEEEFLSLQVELQKSKSSIDRCYDRVLRDYFEKVR